MSGGKVVASLDAVSAGNMCKASVECYIPTSSHGGMMPIVGFGGYVKATDLAAAIARAEADADCWREGWAFAYSGSRLYGDDGELQDNSAQPFIDWRRDSAQEIRAKIQERGNRAIAAQQAEGE